MYSLAMRTAHSRVAPIVLIGAGLLVSCASSGPSRDAASGEAVDLVLTMDQTHDKFSSAIAPVARVRSGAVVEAHTHEATGGQLSLRSTAADLETLDWDRIHTLTGPLYVEGASPGDVLAVTLLEVHAVEWGWTAVMPDFGFLSGHEHFDAALRTYALPPGQAFVEFGEGVRVPTAPFPGVMGVAPATEEMLSTIPPRANGGNMDDPNMVAGTTIYFPVFVEGALFSIGDGHAAQGLGEVCGTAVECPLRVVYRVEVRKDARRIEEPQYETDEYYATTGFATTIDEAARKATEYMIDHLVAERGLTRTEAYMLCSLAGDLHIAETVDVPHMLVTMHMPKAVFEQGGGERD